MTWESQPGRETGPPSYPPNCPEVQSCPGQPGRLHGRLAGQSAGCRCPAGWPREAKARDPGGRHVWAGPGALGVWPLGVWPRAPSPRGESGIGLCGPGALQAPPKTDTGRGIWGPPPLPGLGGGGVVAGPRCPCVRFEDHVCVLATPCQGALRLTREEGRCDGGAWSGVLKGQAGPGSSESGSKSKQQQQPPRTAAPTRRPPTPHSTTTTTSGAQRAVA